MKHLQLLIALACLPFCAVGQSTLAVSVDTVLMGVSFTFTAVHTTPDSAQIAVDAGIAEVVRIESLISSWDPASQTSAINKYAGTEALKVDKELVDLIIRSKKVSLMSAGHFDISFGSIQKVWNFTTFDQDALPTKEALASSVALINYKDIKVDAEQSTVLLAEKGMRIGFGGIGKGYAANQARDLMQKLGASAGVVNAGGDLIAWGQKPEGGPWLVGIADPKDDHNVLGWIDATDMAVVTSGNYKKFITIDGKRYCHIVNPHTGWPVENLTSVTVACPDAELADALATTVFVLGKKDGMALINKLAGVECLILDDSGDLLTSTGMHIQPN